MVERVTVNHHAAGSSPASGAKIRKGRLYTKGGLFLLKRPFSVYPVSPHLLEGYDVLSSCQAGKSLERAGLSWIISATFLKSIGIFPRSCGGLRPTRRGLICFVDAPNHDVVQGAGNIEASLAWHWFIILKNSSCQETYQIATTFPRYVPKVRGPWRGHLRFGGRCFFRSFQFPRHACHGDHVSISYFKAVTNCTLVAEAEEVSINPKLATYLIPVYDDTGNKVALFPGTVYKKGSCRALCEVMRKG